MRICINKEEESAYILAQTNSEKKGTTYIGRLNLNYEHTLALDLGAAYTRKDGTRVYEVPDDTRVKLMDGMRRHPDILDVDGNVVMAGGTSIARRRVYTLVLPEGWTGSADTREVTQ